MAQDHTAHVSVTVDAPPDRVWNALIEPSAIKQYLYEADIKTDWQVGSPIEWSGEYEGKPFTDKGEVIDVQPEKRLEYTHFSPMNGKPDAPENYHRIVVELRPQGESTQVDLYQDGNADDEERGHSEEMWEEIMGKMKEVAEQG